VRVRPHLAAYGALDQVGIWAGVNRGIGALTAPCRRRPPDQSRARQSRSRSACGSESQRSHWVTSKVAENAHRAADLRALLAIHVALTRGIEGRHPKW